jgi:hypothetical protein
MNRKEIPGRGYKKLVWEPKMTSGRGLSQGEGILTPRFDYAHEQQRDVLSISCHDCEQGTEMHDRLKK